jgi:hypothetical protein
MEREHGSCSHGSADQPYFSPENRHSWLFSVSSIWASFLTERIIFMSDLCRYWQARWPIQPSGNTQGSNIGLP